MRRPVLSKELCVSLNRHTMLILMLAGSVGVPYLSTPDGQRGSKAVASAEQSLDGASTSSAGSTYARHEQPPTTRPTPTGSDYSSSTGVSKYSTPAQTVSSNSESKSYESGTAATATGASEAVLTTGQSGVAAGSSTKSSAAAQKPGEPASLEGVPPQTLREVLRFDITIPGIIYRWPRVSSGLSELDLHGYRVPFTSGPSEGEVAGSLTYYFNKKQQLDRIIFVGTCADARLLVTIVTGSYELKRVIVNDPGMAFYQRKSWGKSHSELRVRPARVIRSDAASKRFEFEMALKRP
jgi:hypothetical protein